MRTRLSIAGDVAFCIVLAMGAATSGAANGLTVISDNGATELAAPYLEILNEAPEDGAEAPPDASLQGAADLRQLLPIHSPGLSPGAVSPITVNRPFVSPLFMIGSDPQSLRWTVARRAHLKAIGAVGLLVEVPDERALARILAATGTLPVVPASGSELAERLQVQHYPVLISQDGISQ